MELITTLNIGLAVAGMPDNDPQDVLTKVRALFPGSLRGYRVAMSDTERTFVCRLALDPAHDTGYDFTGRIYKLAVNLGQDCIAVAFAGVPCGDLIGPNAKAWGKFDRRYFIAYE